MYDRYLNADPLVSVERACAITETVASVEYLSTTASRKHGGLNDWKYLKSQFPPGVATIWNKLSEEQAETIFKTIQCLRIGHNLILASPIKNNKIRAWCNVFEAGTHLFLQPKLLYGTDGSDQLSFLGNAAAALGRVGGSETTRKAASDFLALQVILSYIVAGLAKMPGSRWANGDALEKIMGTQTYGDNKLYGLLRKYPKLGKSITRSTVIIESAMPLGLATKGSTKLTLLLFGMFHLANAKFMGLGRFVLPFISTYPAIWSLRTRR
ncbi:hypothetical protein QP119_05050 [Corynebacterium frankenforstense]|uniref:hypothetical protein n=1 Tax=Corynebacterium TaxID=1716 RepID=UPI00254EDA04|nr:MULTISPECIES: hypothetical protein [Corynebacterium]MDK6259791.1 hypothetical protein [Corynebacterium frankenforstense]MDK8894261.1 hypothetical protein [Corynebacterium sp. MSK006]